MRSEKIAKTPLKRRFGANFPYVQVFGHAGSESEVHFETGSSILGVSAHGSEQITKNTLRTPLLG